MQHFSNVQLTGPPAGNDDDDGRNAKDSKHVAEMDATGEVSQSLRELSSRNIEDLDRGMDQLGRDSVRRDSTGNDVELRYRPNTRDSKQQLLNLRESNMYSSKEVGDGSKGSICRTHDREIVVPTLSNALSKGKADKLHYLIEPFHPEDARLPTGGEMWTFTKRRLPFLSWVGLTNWATFKADVVAGFTILVMVVPQGMSYADIAGLPIIYGLYATATPCIVYALTGNSRQLAVGPTALVAILTGAALDGLLDESECPEYYEDGFSGNQSEACPDAYARLAITCGFVTGFIQLGAAILQLGFVVQFLGFPVVSGFTSAASFLIALTQVKNIMGFSIERSQFIYITIGEIVANIGDTNPIQAVLGFAFFFMLEASKKAARKYKMFSWLRALGPLIFCVIAAVIVKAGNLDQTQGVTVVGYVPAGLPPVSVDYNLGALSRLIVPSITIVIVSYMVEIANSKTLAALHGYEVWAGQELFALGSMNFFGSMFSGYPVTGSFSRSSVANSVGATTQLFGLITGLGMLVSLAVLTPAFQYLPTFVLGAIVLSSVVNLFRYEDAIELWKTKRTDGFLWVLAFLGTLFLGILIGLAIAVLASLVLVIAESVRPQVALLWKVPGTKEYRMVKQSPNGEWVQGVLIVRFGSSMYFANMAYIRDTIQLLISQGEHEQEIKYVVLEMSPVNTIDVSAIHILKDTVKEFTKRDIFLCFANTNPRVQAVLDRSEFPLKYGKEWFYHPTTASAVEQCIRHRSLTQVRIMVDGEQPHFDGRDENHLRGERAGQDKEVTGGVANKGRPVADLGVIREEHKGQSPSTREA